MYRGFSIQKIGSKGRIRLLASCAQEILTRGRSNAIMLSYIDEADGVLYGYDMDGWANMEREILSNTPVIHSGRIAQAPSEHAHRCKLGKDNRLKIPHPLKQIARIKSMVRIVGDFDHFEIMSKERWDEGSKESELGDTETRVNIETLGL